MHIHVWCLAHSLGTKNGDEEKEEEEKEGESSGEEEGESSFNLIVLEEDGEQDKVNSTHCPSLPLLHLTD